STFLIDWLVLIALLGGPRLAYRLFKDRGFGRIIEPGRAQSVPVLLVSTKEGADTFIRETVRDRNAVYRVVGMLSDTPSRVGRPAHSRHRRRRHDRLRARPPARRARPGPTDPGR